MSKYSAVVAKANIALKRVESGEIIDLLRQTSVDWHKNDACKIDAFFREEAKKPLHKRQNYCLISCNCSNCRPIML